MNPYLTFAIISGGGTVGAFIAWSLLRVLGVLP